MGLSSITLDPMWRERMGELDVRIAMAVEEDRKKMSVWLDGNVSFPHDRRITDLRECPMCALVLKLHNGEAPWDES
ncbi:hypothetical protein LCGC14_2266820 [marine sediment metagenome]|uniref:Uncharacterized protein n=1 Tax=marine sediment metagenome TaxID=412755 RepID=A0A0F9CYE1_9ZZZZ